MKNEDIEYWITVNGNHIPVARGQTKEEAFAMFLKEKDDSRGYSAEELKARLVTSPEKAYGFANKKRLETAHHKAHAKEMGFKNQKEYERAACEFFNGDKGKLYYEQRRKRFYRYDETRKMLAISSEGIVHTFAIYTKKEFEKVEKQEGLYEL